MLQALVVVVNPSPGKGNPKVSKSEHYIKKSVCDMCVARTESMWITERGKFQKNHIIPARALIHHVLHAFFTSLMREEIFNQAVRFAFLLNTASHSKKLQYTKSLPLSLFLHGPGCHLHESVCSCQPRVRPHLRRPLFLQKTSRLPDPLSHFSLRRLARWPRHSGWERTSLTRWTLNSTTSWC